MSDVIVGIDPGVKGGAGIIDESGTFPSIEGVSNPYSFSGKEMTEIGKWFKAIDSSDEITVIKVYLEKIGARPKDRNQLKQFAVLHKHYSALTGIIAFMGWKCTEVSPDLWQGKLQCRSGSDKTILMARAVHLHPEIKLITPSTQDGILIAHYGWREEYELWDKMYD